MQPIETTRAHCVDPETLAAWVDGGLAAPAAAEVEAHLATCARCQSVLAAFSATDSDVRGVGAVVLPFWSRRPVQVAAAALAVAASITLWTLNRPIEPAPMPTRIPDSVVVQAPPAPATAASPTPTSSRSTPPTPPTSPTPPTPRPTVSRPVAAPVVAEPPPVAAPPPPPAAATPPPPAPAPPPNPASTTAVGRREQVAFSPMAEMAAPRPTFEVTSASDQNASLAADGLVPPNAGRGGAGRGAVGNVAGALARRPLVRWRVTAAVVERSADSGRTWERLDLDPPFTLTAGSAPFQNVCWLVGQDGVVFRTTNGTSFERMTPPDKVHLLVVVAIDALRAMVTAVDGRIFETTDGGVTWTVRK